MLKSFFIELDPVWWRGTRSITKLRQDDPNSLAPPVIPSCVVHWRTVETKAIRSGGCLHLFNERTLDWQCRLGRRLPWWALFPDQINLYTREKPSKKYIKLLYYISLDTASFNQDQTKKRAFSNHVKRINNLQAGIVSHLIDAKEKYSDGSLRYTTKSDLNHPSQGL